MVVIAEGVLSGGEGEDRVGKGHGGGSFVRLAFIRRAGPALERPFTARICVRARARVGAGAVRAPDCPREADAGRISPVGRIGVGPHARRGGLLRRVMECHINLCFVMVVLAEGFLAGGRGEGRVGKGHGRAAPSFGSCSSGAPARLWSDPLPRAFACGRGRALAPARFARLIARARRMQDAPRLSAESGSVRTGPVRAGRGPWMPLPLHPL